MAAFSRGINLFALPCAARLSLYQNHQLLLRPIRVERFSTAVVQRYAAAATAKTPPNSPRDVQPSTTRTTKPKPTTSKPPAPPQKFASTQPTYRPTSIADGFKEETLLYQAPDQRMLLFCSYTSTALLATYGAYCASLWHHTPAGSPWYVSTLPLGLSFALWGMGAWTLGAPGGRLLRVWALPNARPGAELRLRLEGKRVVPFLSKAVVVPAERVRVSALLADVVMEPLRLRSPIGEAPVWVRPFVRFGRWCGSVFENTKAVMFRSVFVYWGVPGGLMNRVWKLDVRGMAKGGARGELISTLVCEMGC